MVTNVYTRSTIGYSAVYRQSISATANIKNKNNLVAVGDPSEHKRMNSVNCGGKSFCLKYMHEQEIL